MTFLTVVTRCYKRPVMLETDMDYEQLFITDEEGKGIGWANRSLVMVEPVGDYVMVLDDDDMLSNDQAIELLKEAAIDQPELIIFRATHNGLGTLPSNAIWGKRPLKGHIGSCDFISRRDVWEKYIHCFGVDEGGDYAYLHAVWMDRPRVYWLDEVLASVQRISHGAPA
jgi:cellulose synthase/poly-beta-1,6-N-acetylglucosamine synthase-like glycosyltransferase